MFLDAEKPANDTDGNDMVENDLQRVFKKFHMEILEDFPTFPYVFFECTATVVG